jgi:hypothetical protein
VLRWAARSIGRYQFEASRSFVPKIRRALPESVFYLFKLDPKSGKRRGPFGTGFFVIRPGLGEPHIYGITNWHVARQQGASIVRVNTRDGKSRFIELDPSEWECPKDNDDLAAVDLTERMKPEDDLLCLFEDMFITPEIIKDFDIGVGDDVFMCGLFASHHGGERNVPVARFGNISMMANSQAPIELETRAELPCHLVDTRSRSGFSGSPVFAYRISGTDLELIPYGWKRDMGKGGMVQIDSPKGRFWGLLGIHCGQFWDTVEVRTARRKTEASGDPIKEGDKLLIQSGMTIVIPAWRIKQLLDLEVFEVARKKRDAELEERALRRPRPESADDVPANDEKAKH